jgi:hypothetical protein
MDDHQRNDQSETVSLTTVEQTAENATSSSAASQWEGYRVQEGVVHLKNFLSPFDQKCLWEDIRASSVGYKPTRARNPVSTFMKILAFDYKKDIDNIPQTFKLFAASACKSASTVCEAVPRDFVRAEDNIDEDSWSVEYSSKL